MATILTKRSNTASSVPVAGDLTNSTGGAELAVNTADKRLFTKDSGDTVVELGTNPSSITLASGTANAVPYLNGSKVLTTGSALQFDGNNLGLGVTPSAWNSGYKGIDITTYGAIYSRTATNSLEILTNAYRNSASNYIYKNNGTAQYIEAANGAYAFYIAPSGTAGNAISFTQAMTLDASGNLLLGTTSASGLAQKYLDINATANCGVNLKAGDVSQGYIYADDGTNEMRVAATGASNVNALTFYAGGSERARIDSSGNLLVGTTSSGLGEPRASIYAGGAGSRHALTLKGSTDSGYDVQLVWHPATSGTRRLIEFGVGTVYAIVGNIASNGSTTSYNTTSDYRLKENIQPMTGALAKVAALKPCTYKWKADGSDGEGFIAHELAEVVPQCVTGEKDAVDADGNPVYQGIDTSFLVATLTAAIQELKAEFDAYKASHP